MSPTQIKKAKKWQGTETNYLDKDSKSSGNETFRAT
jgi:hypothetical protein